MALAGVSDVYSQSNDLLKAFLCINISESQVYRVTDYLGQLTSDHVTTEIKHPQLAEQERVYASMDGSMIQMDHGWQEAKLGRIYRETSRKENGEKNGSQIRYRLDESIYSAHLGSYTDFIPKFEASLGNYKDSEGQSHRRPGSVYHRRCNLDTEISNTTLSKFYTYLRLLSCS